jgi:hypothetical protein
MFYIYVTHLLSSYELILFFIYIHTHIKKTVIQMRRITLLAAEFANVST